MSFDAESLFSNLAEGGPPLFFPDPPAPVTFNFDQGLASEETFPIEDFKRLAVKVLERDGGRALEYISFDFDDENQRIIYLSTYIELVLGYTGLREQLAAWLGATQQIDDLEPDSFIVTSGSVQAIAMAMEAFVNPGEGTLVEAATFPYAMRYMQMRDADMRTVAIDSQGIDTDDLERRLIEFRKDGVRPKLLYVIPTFQLPTGVVTPLERRRRILELAEEFDIVVLEDNVYGDLRFEGEPLPTLLNLDTTGRVIQSHSFSKILAPALRLGWMAGRPEMIAGLAAVRRDLGVSQWFARLVAEFMAEGRLDDHIVSANAVYRRKRDLAAKAVRQYCEPYVSFEEPSGGFYLWLHISEDVDWDAAQHEAAMNGVFFRPGEVFMGEEDGQRFLRLAFSHVGDVELERGIEVLGKAIHSAVA